MKHGDFTQTREKEECLDGPRFIAVGHGVKEMPWLRIWEPATRTRTPHVCPELKVLHSASRSGCKLP